MTGRWGIVGTAAALVVRVSIEHAALLAIAARSVPASRGTLRAVGPATTIGVAALILPASASSTSVRMPLCAIYLIFGGPAAAVGRWPIGRWPVGRAAADVVVDPRRAAPIGGRR